MEDEKRAAADRDLAIKRAAYKAEVNQAEAAAAVAFDIEKAKQGQTVVREQTKQRAEEALILLDVQGTEALTMQKQKEGLSLAMLIEEKNKAEAIRAKADVSAKSVSLRTVVCATLCRTGRAGLGRVLPAVCCLKRHVLAVLRVVVASSSSSVFIANPAGAAVHLHHPTPTSRVQPSLRCRARPLSSAPPYVNLILFSSF